MFMYIYKHDIGYNASSYLARRSDSDKALQDEALEIASNPKYDRYQRGLDSMVYNLFDKKPS